MKTKCKICGAESEDSQLCNNCWEVESRIDNFLKSKDGYYIIKNKLDKVRYADE